jgi:hypothetical protein
MLEVPDETADVIREFIQRAALALCPARARRELASIHRSAQRNCLENREGGIWAVLFAEAWRQNKPLYLSCRLMEMPV